MPLPNDAQSGRARVIYRHYERLYRLATLVSGNLIVAAALVQSAYRQLPADTGSIPDLEGFLIRALLDARQLRRARWTFAQPDLTRTTLEPGQATALLRQIAALPPAGRLAIGLTYINGSAPDEIGQLLGAALGEHTPGELLARFRIGAARALGHIPASTEDALLLQLDQFIGGELAGEQALAMRRDLIAQPELRDLRDALIEARERLPQMVPALFATTPPPTLANQLLALAQAEQRPERPKLPQRRAQLLLAVGVLAIAAAIMLWPTLAQRVGTPSAARAPGVPELLENAMHRFDRAPLQQGVLHELYRVDSGPQGATIIERWYDYASPHRLAIRVSREGQENAPLMQIGSDGHSIAQFRYASRNSGATPLDVQLSAEEAQKIVPLLRSLPHDSTFARGSNQPTDIGPLYIAQARASSASYLGQVNLLGRPAFLLTYQTSQIPAARPRSTNGQPVRVLLTIDAQTYTLLDIAVIGAGEAESTAQHPLQAQQFEVLDSAPDMRFMLAPDPNMARRTSIASIQFPFIDEALLLSIDDAAQDTSLGLLAPLDLPDQHMRGLAIKSQMHDQSEIVLLYEGEFQNIVVLPNFNPGTNQQLGEEQTAGAFRYRLVADPLFGRGLAAVVYRPDADQPLGLILNDDFATADERKATLQKLVASLTPVDSQALPALRQNFSPPNATVGSS